MTAAAESALHRPMQLAALRSPLAEAVGLSLLTLVVYWVTGPEVRGDMWPPLAEAFLNGQLHLAEDRPWLELVPRAEGGQYVPLPPVPAVTLLPLAVVTGPGMPWGEMPGNVYASIVGAINVGLAYWLLLGLGVGASPRRWLTIGFAFTTHWWVAGMGGPHHYAEICAVVFGLGGLNLAVRGRHALAAGLLLGLAAGSRLPAGLALPAYAALYAYRPTDGWRLRGEHLRLLSGVAVPALLLAAYNIARFGSPVDFGYAHIPHGDTGLITDEPWFTEGLLSLSYIPRHLTVMFIDSFQIVDQAPFLRPSLSGASLVLTAPFLFCAVLARGRMVPWLWLSILLVMLPDVMWGTWGFAQFGYRRILDAVPLLLVLLAMVFRERIDWLGRGTVAFGVVVHAYGIYVINVLGFVE
jgi:hypothetical protein